MKFQFKTQLVKTRLRRPAVFLAVLGAFLFWELSSGIEVAQAAGQETQNAGHRAARHSRLHAKKKLPKASMPSKKQKRGLASVKKKSKHKPKKTSQRLETYPAIVES